MTTSKSFHRNRNSAASGRSIVAACFIAFVAASMTMKTTMCIHCVDAITSGTSTTLHNTANNSEQKRRGKVLEERFDEHDLLRAFQEIKSEYLEKAFGDTSDVASFAKDKEWKLLATMNPNKSKNNKEEEIIKVSMLEHPSDPLCPYVKMETVIPKPVERCWDFLSLDKWDETMPKMDPFYEGLDIYAKYDVHEEASCGGGVDHDDDAIRMVLARKRTKRILAFGKREFVFVSVEDKPLEDGTWVSGTVSVEIDEEDSPTSDQNKKHHRKKTSTVRALPSLRRNKSYTRAFQDSIAFYKPMRKTSVDDEGRTRLTIVCRIDLNDSNEEYGSGGCIPMWLYVKTIGMTGARSVLNMRRCLLEE